MTNKTDKKQNPARDEEVIFAYSRQEAIEDGVLVDVTDRAKEAGYRYPVAVSQALWADITAIPQGQSHQDVEGRLWDILTMGIQAIRASKEKSSTLFYELILHVGSKKRCRVKMVCGPGDDGEPVLTLLRPEED